MLNGDVQMMMMTARSCRRDVKANQCDNTLIICFTLTMK